MLANGAKLSYKKESEASYTELAGLKEIPEMGIDAEKVENTGLNDSIKQYEMGIGDVGDIQYTFKYDNKSEKSVYRVIRGLSDTGDTYKWKETLADGTTTEFEGPCSVKRTGGGVNGVMECTLTIYLQSELTITDPT